MITLAIDASTYRGTVAVLDDDRLIVEHAVAMRAKDAELLMPAVDQALRDAGHRADSLQRIVCGAGPGSFTSLRIAASIAKGIAVGRSIPLFAASSLALIVAGNVQHGSQGVRRYLAVLDALRGESYVAVFEHAEGKVRPVGDARIVRSEAVVTEAEGEQARAVGPEQAEAWQPRARGVALLRDVIEEAGAVDLGTWEPVYGRLAEAQAKWEATHGRALPR